MTASDHLNPQQFPIERLDNAVSSDRGYRMADLPGHFGYTFRRQSMRDLRDDIAEHGIQQPVEIKQMSTGEDVVWNGHHRYTVAKRLGMSEVPVEHTGMMDPSDEDHVKRMHGYGR